MHDHSLLPDHSNLTAVGWFYWFVNWPAWAGVAQPGVFAIHVSMHFWYLIDVKCYHIFCQKQVSVSSSINLWSLSKFIMRNLHQELAGSKYCLHSAWKIEMPFRPVEGGDECSRWLGPVLIWKLTINNLSRRAQILVYIPYGSMKPMSKDYCLLRLLF